MFIQAQYLSIEGKIIDSETKKGIPYVNIYLENTSYGTVTNDSGLFTFKFNASSIGKNLIISLIGYKEIKKELIASDTGIFHELFMEPAFVLLKRTTVEDEESSLVDLLQKMKRKIAENYSKKPEMQSIFYREQINLDNRKIKIQNVRRKKNVDEELPKGIGKKLTEAILEVYKQPYSGERVKEKDKLKIIKGRRRKMVAKTESDSMLNDILREASILGGPHGLLQYEPVRPHEEFDFLHKRAYKKYEFSSRGIIEYKGRDIIVVDFDQKKKVKKSLYKGVLYIDGNDHALVAADFGLSPRGLPHFSLGFLANTALAIYGLDFTLKRADFSFRYQFYRGTWCLSYAGGNAEISIFMDKEKRKKQIALDFDFELDVRLAVTNIDRIHVHEFTEEEIKASSKAMENIDDDNIDDEFWEQYNFVQLSPENL